MKDQDKTKEQLINELVKMRQRISKLETSETGLKREEEKRAHYQQWLEALWKMGRMVDANGQSLCDHLLVEAIRITQSRYGFHGFLNEDESVFTFYSFSKEVMRDCQIRDKPIEFPIVKAGLWADAVRERRTLIINDYQTDHASKKGLPKGHVPLTRILVVPLFSHGRIVALVAVANKPSDYTEEDARQIEALGTSMQTILERKQAQQELKQSFEKLQRSLEGTVYALASTADKRDPYTAGHQQGVTRLACAIAKEMGLPEEQIEGIRMAGLIHDIGKIYVPAEILSKPGTLSETEMNLIKTHPQVGYDILKTVEFRWPIAQIVLQHQERMNGSGYPQGLSGKEILLEARILAVADVVEAMASHRPYRPARGIDKALEEISQNRGVLYDPEAVDACLRLFTKKGFKFE